MELKTVKEFAHKNNLGEGLKFESGLFQLDLDKEFNTIASSLNQLNTKVNQINEQLGTVYKVKGSTTVDNINSMTVGNAMIGYVYNLLDSGVITNGIEGELEVVKGNNIVYTEDGWDEFAVSLNLDQCAGDNISIEDNIISALGYKYNPSHKSITIGNEHNIATGYLAFAQGDGTRATGEKSHTEGGQTTASGRQAHAEGSNTIAKGDFSHTEGKGTQTNNESEHAQGQYNISNIGTDTDDKTTLHSIGIGTSSERKNAHEVMNNGDTFIVGIGGYDGTNPYEAQTLQKVVNSKVDKEDNKGLSTEDYTTEEKTKLSSIEEGAQVNIQSDWNQLDETSKDYIKNKPDLTVYQLKEEGKFLTSNDYTTEDKEKLSGIEAGAQVNEVTSVNNMKGDVTIVTNQAFPESFNINGTTLEFAQSINLEDTAINGMTYLGGVSLSDLPEPLVNAKCLVQVISSVGDGSKVIHFDLYSADTQPYHWSCMYYNSSVSNWVSYVTAEDQASIIESLEQEINLLKEKVNSKEYSIDFESDSTTAQEINLMDSMSLKKLVGYNITSVNLQIGTGSAVNLVLTDNVWEGDPIVINQGERVYWDIVKYDESAPAVLGIYETKIL